MHLMRSFHYPHSHGEEDGAVTTVKSLMKGDYHIALLAHRATSLEHGCSSATKEEGDHISAGMDQSHVPQGQFCVLHQMLNIEKIVIKRMFCVLEKISCPFL